jgi:hypothetical protein
MEDLSSCKHENKKLIQGSRFSGEHESGRNSVNVCMNCGEVFVSGIQNGQWFNVSFHINSEKVLGAMQNWISYVFQDS